MNVQCSLSIAVTCVLCPPYKSCVILCCMLSVKMLYKCLAAQLAPVSSDPGSRDQTYICLSSSLSLLSSATSSQGRLTPHNVYLFNNITEKKWNKTKKENLNVLDINNLSLVFFSAITFPHSSLPSSSLFLISLHPSSSFHAGDEVVWQNVPQQQKE